MVVFIVRIIKITPIRNLIKCSSISIHHLLCYLSIFQRDFKWERRYGIDREPPCRNVSGPARHHADVESKSVHIRWHGTSESSCRGYATTLQYTGNLTDLVQFTEIDDTQIRFFLSGIVHSLHRVFSRLPVPAIDICISTQKKPVQLPLPSRFHQWSPLS